MPIHRPRTFTEFQQVNRQLENRHFASIDEVRERYLGNIEALKSGKVHSIQLGDRDPSATEVNSMATSMGCGAWSNGPLAKLAWSFDSRDNAVKAVTDKDGKTPLAWATWSGDPTTPRPQSYHRWHSRVPTRRHR